MIKSISVRAGSVFVLVAGAALSFSAATAHAAVTPFSRTMHVEAHVDAQNPNPDVDSMPPDVTLGPVFGDVTDPTTAISLDGISASASSRTSIAANGSMLFQIELSQSGYPTIVNPPRSSAFAEIVFDLTETTTFKQIMTSQKSSLAFASPATYTFTESSLGAFGVPGSFTGTMAVTTDFFTLPAGHFTARMSLQGRGSMGAAATESWSSQLSVVPEPASAAVLLLVSLAGVRRRRRCIA